MYKKIGLLFSGLFVIIGSWIIIHILAVGGVFVALAKPLFWVIFPEISFCFVCRTKKTGDWCPTCQRKVTEDFRIYRFRSVIINSLIILICSLFSIGAVWLETRVLAAAGIINLHNKTVSFTIPDRLQYRLGEIFPMKLEMVDIEEPINVIQADIRFNPEKLEADIINTDGSLATVFVQKEINNEVGFVRLTGGLPGSGFKGSKGLFGTVFFHGKMPGLAKIEYLPTSMVLASDGKGSNVIKNLAAATFLILPESISKQEAEEQKGLLSKNVLGESTYDVMRMDFSNEVQVLGARLGIDQAGEILGQKVKTTKSLVWQILEEIDQFILTLWSEIIAWLAHPFKQ